MFGPGAVAESCTLLQLVLSAASKIGLARNLHSGSDWSAASSSGAEELCVLGGCTEREGLGILLLAPSSQLQDLASNKFFYCWIQYGF